MALIIWMFFENFTQSELLNIKNKLSEEQESPVTYKLQAHSSQNKDHYICNKITQTENLKETY